MSSNFLHMFFMFILYTERISEVVLELCVISQLIKEAVMNFRFVYETV